MKKIKSIVGLMLVIIACVAVLVACAPKSPVVTFDSQGGSLVNSATVANGDKVAQPTAPIKKGYTFGGWYREVDCVTKWQFDVDVVKDNVTIYAKWSQAVVVSIAIETKPTKAKYEVGQTFSIGGLKVKGVYDNGEEAILGADAIVVDKTAFDNTVVGEYKIVVKLASNQQLTASFDVAVVKLTKIQVSVDSKQELKFVIGLDGFSWDGLVVEKVYSDGSVVKVEKDEPLKVVGSLKLGEQTATVTLGELTCAYKYNVYDKAKLTPKALFIKQSAAVLNVKDIADIKYDGLVIEMTTVELGDRRIEMLSSEYTPSVATQENKYVVTMTAKKPKTNAPSVSYDVAKIETDGYEFSRLAINPLSMHQQNFYIGELFNFDRLVLQAIFTKAGAPDKVIDVSTFVEGDFNISQYNSDKVGSYTIDVFHSEGGKELKMQYTVNVVASDFDGTYYFEDTNALIDVFYQQLSFKIDNGKLYAYVNGVLDTRGDVYSLARKDGKLLITANTVDYLYDDAAKTFTNAKDKVINKVVTSEQIVLSIKTTVTVVYPVIIVNKNGAILQERIDGLAKMGKLYKTNDKTQLITADTTFAESTTIYLIADQIDYTGKPFVGTYYLSTDIINKAPVLAITGTEISGDIPTMGHQTMGYSAIDNGNGTWTITVLGQQLTFTELTGILSFGGIYNFTKIK